MVQKGNKTMLAATIRTEFGDIRVKFTNADDLKEALQSLGKYVETIREAAREITPPPPPTVDPGYEGIYRFTSSGKLKLLVLPEKQPDTRNAPA